MTAEDQDQIHALVRSDGLFSAEEIAVACELVDEAQANPDADYRVLVAASSDGVDGYVCYGPTPMTAGTWDLYWIVTRPAARGMGVARALVGAMEDALRAAGARLVRVETSRLDGYGAARAFYERMRYPVAAELRDFYRPGDDLIVMLKRL
jgi:ribosomal protein S18 acetylase RimI-like enzyme